MAVIIFSDNFQLFLYMSIFLTIKYLFCQKLYEFLNADIRKIYKKDEDKPRPESHASMELCKLCESLFP